MEDSPESTLLRRRDHHALERQQPTDGLRLGEATSTRRSAHCVSSMDRVACRSFQHFSTRSSPPRVEP